MRKIALLLIMFVSQHVFAQKAAVQTAYNYLKYEDFDKAKEAIDGASINESTMGMAKTWYYRGWIYQSIFESKNAKFAALKPGSAQEAVKSYQKAIELDKKSNEFTEDIKIKLSSLITGLQNEGVDNFNAGRFEEALKNFESALEISKEVFNKPDSLILFNAALAADRAKKNTQAIKYFDELIAIDYQDSKIYNIQANLYLSEKDTANALLTINKGRTKFPDDYDLVIKALNIYLMSNKHKEALAEIDEALIKDPKNAELYNAKGNLSEKMDNKPEAVTSYKKAIEIKPEFFDANYNLGVMYYNEAAELVNKANAIPASKAAEYDVAKKKFEAKFNEARPYFEKAHEINAKDMPTLQSLSMIYAKTGELQKAEAIKKELDALKK